MAYNNSMGLRTQTIPQSVKRTLTSGVYIFESLATSAGLTFDLIRQKLNTAIFDSEVDDLADSAKNIKYAIDDLAMEILDHLTNVTYIQLKELEPKLYETVAGTGKNVLISAIDMLKAKATKQFNTK